MSKRRVGWVYNLASGNLRDIRAGSDNWSEFSSMAVVNSGSSTSWAPADCSALAPPTATYVNVHSYVYGGWTISVGRRGWGFVGHGAGGGTVTWFSAAQIWCPCDPAQFIEYKINAGTGNVSVQGYRDDRQS